ncbi:MAG TPA: hypothetical protein VII97_08105 [Anaerolineales bacterium]
MSRLQPIQLILIGFALMMVGWALPFLMVLQVLESSFALNFLSYIAQVSGLFLGIIGAAMYVRLKKK